MSLSFQVYAQEDGADGSVDSPPDDPGVSGGPGDASDVTVDNAAMDYGGSTGTNDCPGCSPSNNNHTLDDGNNNYAWTADDPSTSPLPPDRPKIDRPILLCSSDHDPLIQFDIYPAARADWYEVYRRDQYGNESLRRSFGFINLRTQFVSGVLTPGVAYNYYVKAYNRDMPNWQNNPVLSIDPDTGSQWVGWMTARTDCGPGKPTAFVIRNDCNGTTARVTLRWDLTANTDYYQIYAQQPGQPSFLAATGLVGAPPQTYIDYDVPGLGYNQDYRFAVVSLTTNGRSNWSDWTSYNQTLNCGAPTPFSARISDNSCTGINQVRVSVSFGSSAYANVYQLRGIDTSNGATTTSLDYTPATLAPYWNAGTNEYTINLTFNSLRNYNFYVTAINSNNNFYIHNDNGTVNDDNKAYRNVSTLNCLRPTPFTLSAPNPYCAGVSQPRITADFSKSANANQYYVFRYKSTPTAGYDVQDLQYYLSTFFPATTQESGSGSYTYGTTNSTITGHDYTYHVIAYNTNLGTVDPSNYYIFSNVPTTGSPGAQQYWTGPVTALDCELPTINLRVRQENTIPYFEGPISIASGFKAEFDWTGLHASPNSCIASGDWSGVQTQNGTILTAQLNNPPTSQIMYTLACTNNNLAAGIPGRTVSDTATVNISPLITPWLQTQGGGDVHSNTNIDIQGGP